MKLMKTNTMFFVLALVSALIFQKSEAAAIKYCSTTNIELIPGCYDALRLAYDKDFRKLSRDCCRAVFSLPTDCVVPIHPGKTYPSTSFRFICINLHLPPILKLSPSS
ncbi:unnamed protein product [Cochlearia groenlandica]